MKDSWLKILQSEGKKEYFQKIITKLSEAEKISEIFPEQTKMFRAFEFFQVNETKVVILGQDPYPTNGFADGLAFSSMNQKQRPKTLQNIFIELQKDYPSVSLRSNSLENWAKQGVLLLNTQLTVSQSQANSHKSFGWELFIVEILREVEKENKNVIYVALGNQAYETYLKANIKIEKIIRLSHPSPLSYNKSFKDGHLFLKINQKLKELNQSEIDFSTK